MVFKCPVWVLATGVPFASWCQGPGCPYGDRRGILIGDGWQRAVIRCSPVVRRASPVLHREQCRIIAARASGILDYSRTRKNTTSCYNLLQQYSV